MVQLFEATTLWTKRRPVILLVGGAIAMNLICSVILTKVISGNPAWAQGAGGPIPTFDAVSIREDRGPLPRQERWDLRPDGYHWRGVPLIALVMAAYPPSSGYTDMFTPDELVNVPDWMLHEVYDVDVKVAAADVAAWKQTAIQKAMLREMLADRLKLTAHYAHKPGPAYELHISKGGVKFKPADQAAIQKQDMQADASPNGSVMAKGKRQGDVVLYNAPVSELCQDLRHMAGRPIVDKTGLTGRYDMVLQLQPPGADASLHDSADTVFYVLEQLGLKLDSVKAPVENLAIDHVERPSEN
jgi:uncharacterized protein (TIGR03435 family)